MQAPTLAGRKLDAYHVCAFFNSRNEEYDIVTPFFKEGLDWGEKTLHIVDPALISDHVDRLRSRHVDTERCMACSQMEVLSWDDVYLRGDVFDQDRMLTAIEEAITAGREAGYPRMRIMGNMGWTLKERPGTEQVLEFESRVNEVLARHRQLAICVYDMAKMSGTLMMDLLRSHPLTLVGGVVYENPYYTPPEKLVSELQKRHQRRDEGNENLQVAPLH